jgi:hypothetical protein
VAAPAERWRSRWLGTARSVTITWCSIPARSSIYARVSNPARSLREPGTFFPDNPVKPLCIWMHVSESEKSSVKYEQPVEHASCFDQALNSLSQPVESPKCSCGAPMRAIMERKRLHIGVSLR